MKSKIHNIKSNLKGGGESKVALGGVEGAESGRAANYEVSGGGGEGSGARVEGVHLEAKLEGTRPSVQEVAAGDRLADLKQEQIMKLNFYETIHVQKKSPVRVPKEVLDNLSSTCSHILPLPTDGLKYSH